MIDEKLIERAVSALETLANAYGWNDDARMQNYWIGVEACVDIRINELEAE